MFVKNLSESIILYKVGGKVIEILPGEIKVISEHDVTFEELKNCYGKHIRLVTDKETIKKIQKEPVEADTVQNIQDTQDNPEIPLIMNEVVLKEIMGQDTEEVTNTEEDNNQEDTEEVTNTEEDNIAERELLESKARELGIRGNIPGMREETLKKKIEEKLEQVQNQDDKTELELSVLEEDFISTED